MAICDNDEEIERGKLYRLFARLFIEEPPDELLLEIKEMFGITAEDLPYEIRLDFTNLLGSSQTLWYCDEVQRHAATTFSKEVANFLKEFILSEHKLINE